MAMDCPVLTRSHDTMPPASIRTERALLGALMVANWQDRDRITAELSTTDFHDPFHRWAFRALRHWRRGKPDDLLPAFRRAHEDAPAPIGERSLSHELAMLLVRRDGEPDCGQVSQLRRMVGDLRALAMARQKQAELECQLVAVLNESDELVRESEYLN